MMHVSYFEATLFSNIDCSYPLVVKAPPRAAKPVPNSAPMKTAPAPKVAMLKEVNEKGHYKY